MTMIILPNAIDPSHLAEVRAAMEQLGAPTIRAIDAGDHLIAIEGSHRIQAAHDLGLAVNVEIVDEDGEIDLDTLDWDDYGWFDERVVPAPDFIDRFTAHPFPAGQPCVDVEVAR